MIELGTDEFTDLFEIGRGGFGVVYTAHQPAFDRTVAVKVLTLADDQTLRRFDRERQALGKVSNHPHITPVFASGFTTDGMPYLAMEMMEGGSLADRIGREGPMPWEEVLSVGVKLAGALETAHRAGILHRDLKPANVLLSGYGEPRLADFGIASLDGGEQTKTGMITASVAYAAPEVLDGHRPAVPADVYALSATLFALLAGAAPFAATTEESILAMVLRVARDPVPDLRPRGVPEALAAVLERGMAKSRDDRFETAAALGEALREAQATLGIPQTRMVLRQPPNGAAGVVDNRTVSLQFPHVPIDQSVPAPPGPGPATRPAPPLAPPTRDQPGNAPPQPPWSVGGSDTEHPPRRRRILPLVLVGLVLVAGVVGVVVVTSSDDPEGEVASEEAVAEPDVTSAPVAAAVESEPQPTGSLQIGDWQTVRPMPVARQQMPGVTLRGTVWVTGGLTQDSVESVVEGYEPATNSWRTGPDLPIPLHHHMTAVYDDELVVLGGWSPEGALLSAITSDRVFALRGSEWVELPPLTIPRVAGVATTVGDLLIVTGGQDSAGELVLTTEVYDGEAWRDVAPMPTPREHLSATTDGTALYVVGGRQLSADLNLPTLERYDPATDEWTTLPDMPTARGGLAAVMLDDVLVAIGGERPLGVFDEVEAYDITDGVWTAWPPLPIARHGLAASVTGSSIVAVGGALEATHSAPTDAAELLGTSSG